MFARFNVASRLIIKDTYSQAGELNHRSIGPEHILLSLVEDRSSLGAQLLSRLGCFPNKVRAAVLSAHPRSEDGDGGAIRVSGPAKQILQEATAQADAMESEEIGPEHLLLALLRQPSSARDVLRGLGVNETDLRTRIKSLEASSPVSGAVAVGGGTALNTSPKADETVVGAVTELDRARLRRRKHLADEDYSTQWADEEDADVVSFEEVVGAGSSSLAEAVSAVDDGPTSRREWLRSIVAAVIIVGVCLVGLSGIYLLGRDSSPEVETVTAPSANNSGQVLPSQPSTPEQSTPAPSDSDSTAANPAENTGDGTSENSDEDSLPAAIDFGLSGVTPGNPSGQIVAVPGEIPAAPAAQTYTYDLSVDSGLGLDVEQTSRAVNQVLNDSRSWAKDGYTASQVTSGGQYHFFVVSAQEVDRACSSDISQGYYSCTVGNSVYLNSDRWYSGDESFLNRGGTLDEYRVYLLNRQLGLALGKPGEECPGAGQLSPVMEPQTRSDSQCQANGWPYPGQN